LDKILGVFIHPKSYPTLVWDVSGYNAVSGASIILYAKKDVIVDTKNQRWQKTSSSQYYIEIDSTFTANVTSSGDLVLAKSSTTSKFQKFYTIGEYDLVAINVWSNMGCIRFTVTSVLGPQDVIQGADEDGECVGESVVTYVVCIGALITILDLQGNMLIDKYNATSNIDMYLPVTSTSPPAGTDHWIGRSSVDAPEGVNDTSVYITFQSDSYFSGYGTDMAGEFDIESGQISPGGRVTFTKFYSIDKQQHCDGGLADGNYMDGLCQSGNDYDFFTLYKDE